MGYRVYIGEMVYIYEVIQTSTSELVYVGQTVNPESRFSTHKTSTVKDIKNDCHMEILEQGIDLTSDDEHFWIEYFHSLGCNLRNKRIRLKDAWPKSRRYGDAVYLMPHLTIGMSRQGITIDQMVKITGLSIQSIIAARNGGVIGWRASHWIDRLMSLGTEIFEGLSEKRTRNLISGCTKPEYVRREQKRRERIAREMAQYAGPRQSNIQL